MVTSRTESTNEGRGGFSRPSLRSEAPSPASRLVLLDAVYVDAGGTLLKCGFETRALSDGEVVVSVTCLWPNAFTLTV